MDETLTEAGQAAVASAFRSSMRRLAGGVALVTTRQGERAYGMVMTAVMSLSMEPPALVLAVNRTASLHDPLQAGAPFCVNLLKHGSEEMCRAFYALPSEQRFSVGEWAEGPGGAPYLADAQAVICCQVGPIHAFGSHSLVVGLVTDAWAETEVAPLIHLDGAYVGAAGMSLA
jgi:flavin reductase